jgi:hypothetical protein
MAEWLRLLISGLSPLDVGSNPARDFWILSCEETIQLGYWMLVVLLGCLFVPEIMYIGTCKVFIHQLSLNWPFDFFHVGVM